MIAVEIVAHGLDFRWSARGVVGARRRHVKYQNGPSPSPPGFATWLRVSVTVNVTDSARREVGVADRRRAPRARSTAGRDRSGPVAPVPRRRHDRVRRRRPERVEVVEAGQLVGEVQRAELHGVDVALAW